MQKVISEYTVTYSRPTFKTIGHKRIFKYLGPRAQGTYLVVANAVPPPTEHNRASLNSSAGFERPLASQQEKERKTEEGKERNERKGIRQGENIPNKFPVTAFGDCVCFLTGARLLQHRVDPRVL